MPSGKLSDVVTVLCGVALVISLTSNIGQLKRLVLPSTDLPAKRDALVNTSVPPLEVRDAGGAIRTLGVAKTAWKTVVYVYSPDCAWCVENASDVKFLAEHASRTWRFVGVSLASGGVPDFMRQREVSFPMYGEPSAETRSAYRMGATPQTIVVSPAGKVEKDWYGAYRGSVRTDVEAYFGLRFPAGAPR